MTRAGVVGLLFVTACAPQAAPGGPRESRPVASESTIAAPTIAAPPTTTAPATSPIGAYLAVWDDDRFAGNHARRAVFASRIAGDGSVLDPQGIAIDDRFTAFETQPVATATTTGWLAAWERLDSDHAQRIRQIWARRIARDGTLGPLLELSAPSQNKDAQIAAAGDNDDALVVWWHNRPPSVQAALVTGDTVTRIDFGLPVMSVHPGVAFDAKANVWLIVWRDALGGIRGTRVDRSGKLLDVPFVVVARDTRPRWDLGPRVASNGAGELLVTWASGDDKSLRGVRVDAATGAVLAAPATLTTAPSPIFRHAIGAAPGGYALAWIEMPRAKDRTLNGLWIAKDGATAPLVLPAQPGIGYAPAFQATAQGLLASWHQSPEPRAARIDARGRVDAQPIAPRATSPASAPIPATAAVSLTATLDAVAANGADYCGTTRDRTLPGAVTGVLVEEGPHPWGSVHAPGFGWGYPPAGVEPGWKFYVGRDWSFAPKLTPRPGTKGIAMSITVLDANRHRVERMETASPSRDALTALGLDGSIGLLEVEVNGGLGGRGSHFVMTKVRVLESAATLGPRLAKLRKRFDATVAAHQRSIDRLLRAEDAKLKAATKHPIRSKLPRTTSVVFEPTWRPTTRRLEVLFGYQVQGGYVVDLPASDPGHSKMESRPAGPAPVRYGVYMGARYTLDGDRVLTEELFLPRTLTRQAPWDCVAAEPARPIP